jgi:hypothetical protein
MQIVAARIRASFSPGATSISIGVADAEPALADLGDLVTARNLVLMADDLRLGAQLAAATEFDGGGLAGARPPPC